MTMYEITKQLADAVRLNLAGHFSVQKQTEALAAYDTAKDTPADDALTIAYMAGSASRMDELRAKDAEIEALRKQCSADGFVSVEDVKVRLPERYWHHDVGHFYAAEEVIDAITAANVEIES